MEEQKSKEEEKWVGRWAIVEEEKVVMVVLELGIGKGEIRRLGEENELPDRSNAFESRESRIESVLDQIHHMECA
uniref:Uncharacterized protein n=1 Tax=Vespula pensylvanica TaxID=30213 RepID=A0A834P9S5_VESPE|nr:hypothetical protein H0235_002406 [Vespula pensylvanica]